MAIKLKKPIEQHVYFNSSINKEKEVFETIESVIGFDEIEFANRIWGELRFLGMEVHELCTSTYISKHRMTALLSGKVKFEYAEIKSISKRLNF